MDLAEKIGIENLKKRLVDIVGEGGVSGEAAVLSAYAPGSKELPVLVVRPSTAAQVGELVKLANEVDLNLVPVSSGPPHVSGASRPMAGAVMVDLSGMDKIIRKERRNKVAMIEPGVTFGQLKEAVDSLGLRMLTPLLPRTTKSVLASELEREPITTPKYHWDMNDPLLCTEVWFGSGSSSEPARPRAREPSNNSWPRGMPRRTPWGRPSPTWCGWCRVRRGPWAS